MQRNKAASSPDSSTTVNENRGMWLSSFHWKFENFHNTFILWLLQTCVVLPVIVLKKRNFKRRNVFSVYFHVDFLNVFRNLFLINKLKGDVFNYSFSVIDPVVDTNWIYSFFFSITKHNYVVDLICNYHVPPVVQCLA